MVDYSTANQRWQISKQPIQDRGFQNRWYKMADIRTAYPRFLKRWSKMADFIRVDPSRRISEQLNQDGGFQNSWYKRRISKLLIQDGGLQNSGPRTADTKWQIPKQLICLSRSQKDRLSNGGQPRRDSLHFRPRILNRENYNNFK